MIWYTQMQGFVSFETSYSQKNHYIFQTAMQFFCPEALTSEACIYSYMFKTTEYRKPQMKI